MFDFSISNIILHLAVFGIIVIVVDACVVWITERLT